MTCVCRPQTARKWCAEVSVSNPLMPYPHIVELAEPAVTWLQSPSSVMAASWISGTIQLLGHVAVEPEDLPGTEANLGEETGEAALHARECRKVAFHHLAERVMRVDEDDAARSLSGRGILIGRPSAR